MKPQAATEPVYRALDPRGFHPAVYLHLLASRFADLNGKVVYLLAQRQPGSEVETIFAMVKDELVRRFPAVKLVSAYKPSAYMEDDPELWDEMVKTGDAFIYGAAPSASTTHWTIAWAANLEERGLAGSVIIYDTFAGTAKATTKAKGVPLRWVATSYPPANMGKKQRAELTDKVIRGITEQPSDREKKTGKYAPPRPSRIAVVGILDKIQQYFEERKWTDGLPIVAPTEQKVAAMLQGTSHAPDEIVATTVWPEKLHATVEKVAINGVMAGCRPEYMPVLLAAVEAWSKGAFSSSVRSTNSFSYMQVVNGPIRREINANAGISALGPGNHANATIGRALRLCIINLGNARVGVNLLATIGNPTAYTFCFPENEEDSPWEPYSTKLGYKRGESTVAILGGGWSHLGNYLTGDIERMARDSRVLEYPDGLVALLSPLAARAEAEKGRSKEDVEELIWRTATLPIKEFRRDIFYPLFIEPMLKGKAMGGEKYMWPKEYLTLPEDIEVPVYPRQNVSVIVVGGKTSPMMQAWKMSHPSIASVDKWR